MPRISAILLLSACLPAGAVFAQNSLDGLIDIPRPSADAPVFGPIETIPMIDAPFPAEPAAPSALGVPYEPTTDGVPFFEFSDEPAVAAPSSPQVLWPGDVRTPADEEPPILGNGNVGHLLISPQEAAAQAQAELKAADAVGAIPSLGARSVQEVLVPVIPGPIPVPPEAVIVAPTAVPDILPVPAEPPAPIETDPNARFSFRDNPDTPALPAGAMLSIPPGSTVQGHFVGEGRPDGEWDGQAGGLGVARVDLPAGMGGVTLVLGAQNPVFWGITAGRGTQIDGVVLYGDTATYSSFGAKTTTRERALVVRRPELGKDQIGQLVRDGGGGVIAWQ